MAQSLPVDGAPGKPEVNIVKEVAAGLWLVRFASPDTMDSDACAHLVPPLIHASKAGPLVVLATMPPGVRTIPASLVTFWLNAMAGGGIRVKGIAVVTTGLAVRAVVNGFGLAMKIREHPILAFTFPTEEQALAWGRSVVSGS